MAMNPEIKKQWVDALRSGEYEQGVGYLRAGNEYCCLGVLCDLHSKATGTPWEGERYFGASAFVPTEVKEWAGLRTANPKVEDGEESAYLVGLNDSLVPFLKIADAIEASL